MADHQPPRRTATVLALAALLVTGVLAATSAGAHEGDPAEDAATKNAISRSLETGEQVDDPTGPVEKAGHATAVAAGRRTPDPELTTVPLRRPRGAHPADRYEMAGGCYTLVDGGEPLYFQATSLGHYLLYDAQRRFVSADGGKAAEPGQDTIWRADMAGSRTTLTSRGSTLTVDGQDSFLLTTTDGCARYPESQVDVKGAPFAGVSAFQEVRGYVDAHTHGMAYEFLGGGAHCGKPWDRFGAPYALVDCEDHQTGTNPLEAALSGRPYHDPVGWPTFKDWPAPDSLTHEGTYYKWMERSWRSGQRLFVNLLVENNQLCQLYPYGRDGTPASKNSCDDMDSIRLQARRMHQFEDYIDAQWGGPGRGWYRIVTSPWQARRVINEGKLAVVMGIETSVPFGCTFKAGPTGDQPSCDPSTIDRQLDEVHAMGVRQMELVNKFDNALSGVAGDEGQTGAVVNNANFLETGTYWDMEHCDPAVPGAHDKEQAAAPEISAEQQDALFGAIGEAFGLAGTDLPIYDRPEHCNQRGLTTLGEDVISGLAQRHMLFDPDHMSVLARSEALDQVEEMGYSGVLSSHSWSTPDAYPRIYEMGGFIAPYAGDSTGFVDKWRQHVQWADPRYYFGIGYGADINGLGAQGDPRGVDATDPVTYPFRGLGGVTIGQQHAGERVYDINADGVAQYGLYPDWIEDIEHVADSESGDGDALATDMARGAEAYLQTWERAQGIEPDPCRNPGLRRTPARFRTLVTQGMTTPQVLHAVGQPFLRQDLTYTYCARTASDPDVRLVVDLTRAGRVAGVRRG